MAMPNRQYLQILIMTVIWTSMSSTPVEFLMLRNKLYQNNGQGHYYDVAGSAGAQAFVDMLVLNGFGPAPFHSGQRVPLENRISGNNWIQLKLVGHISNRDGVGALITLQAGPLLLKRQQTGGMHRASQNSQILQFCLGTYEIVDKITIRWPSGIIQKLSNLSVNQRLVVEEPGVSLNLIPNSHSVKKGGELRIETTTTNLTDQNLKFLFGTNLILPNGSTYPSKPQFFYGPIWITLDPFETINGQITHDIPIDAPEGEYVYYGYIGLGWWNIWTKNHFRFAIAP
jgi:hypothetical protein